MNESSELEFDRAECCRRVFEAIPKQKDLAEMVGVTPSAMTNTKKRGACSLELVIAASQITGRSIEWFLFGEEGAPPSLLEERVAALEKDVARLQERVDALASQDPDGQ
ncbi:MAG: helix-turn-helix domain-containing protein [Planctomycetota bacterium]